MLNFEKEIFYHDKITLVGMMGTGKSKFGRLVANYLDYIFYDTDFLIEKNYNTTIKGLFQKYGELFFRKIEKQTIKNLILKVIENNEKVVVSIGGGAFDNKDTRELLLENTKVIWLNTPLNILVDRVGDGSKRPMLKGIKKKNQILFSFSSPTQDR